VFTIFEGETLFTLLLQVFMGELERLV